MFVLDNPHTCMAKLRNYNQKDLSYSNKILNEISELYFLDIFLDKENRANNGEIKEEEEPKFDSSLFLKISILYDSFLAAIESLSEVTIGFW